MAEPLADESSLLEFQPLELQLPSISPFLGDTWWLETIDWSGDAPSSSGEGVGDIPSSGGGNGGIPYAQFDESGRRILGRTVVISSMPQNQTTFQLPEVPISEGYILKVVNATNKPIQASFPQVFTYYGSPVYGQSYPMGGVIYPYEAGIYRSTIAQQGKMNWSWVGTSNQSI